MSDTALALLQLAASASAGAPPTPLLAEGLPSFGSPAPAPSPIEAKQQSLLRTSLQKRAELEGRTEPEPQDFRNAAIMRQTGSGMDSPARPLEYDLSRQTYSEIRENQGRAALANLITQEDRLQALRTGERTLEQSASDAVSGVGQGLFNALAGIGAFGLGAFDALSGETRTGEWASRQIDQVNEAISETQSPALRNRRQANIERTALDVRDNAATALRERSSGQSDLLTSLKQIGRDAFDAVANVAEDPALLGDLTAQGVGSVVAAGPLGRVLSGGARAGQGARTAGTAAGIGLMEGGGAYQQAVSEISQMSEVDLWLGSPAYREMRERGISHEDARSQLANQAGLEAGAITAPLAAGVGQITGAARFESAPLRVPSLRRGLSNLGREAIEEAAQGGLGQAAQNLAIQRNADDARQLIDGVGEQMGLGAIGGLGTAGVLQGPGVVGQTALAGMRRSGEAFLDAVGGAVDQRVESIQAKNDAASPTSATVVTEAMQEAQTKLDEARVQLTEAVQLNTDSSQESEKASAAVEKLLAAAAPLPSEELATLPPDVAAELADAPDRLQVMIRLARMVRAGTREGGDAQKALIAGAVLLQLYEGFEAQGLSDGLDPFRKLPENHPARALIAEYAGLSQTMWQVPEINRALQASQKLLDASRAPKASAPSTLEDVPLSQADVAVLGAQAMVNPEKVDLPTATVALRQASEGKIKLSPEQETALKAAVTILQTAKALAAEQDKLGHRRKIDVVGQQILADVATDGTGPNLSAKGHFKGIIRALQAGNQGEAADRFATLGLFVEHMNNKVEALNKHFALPGRPAPIRYSQLRPWDRQWQESKKGLAVWTTGDGVESSIEFAQRTALEAMAMARIYQGLQAAFPQLGSEPIEAATLNPTLMQGTPAQLTKAFARGELSRGARSQAPAAVPSAAPPAPPPAAPPAETPPAETPPAETPPAEETPPAAPSETTPPAAAPAPTAPTSTEQSAEQVTEETTGETTEETDNVGGFFSRILAPYFKTAFRFPKTQRSRLTARDTPIEDLIRAFSSQANLKAFFDDIEPGYVSDAQRDGAIVQLRKAGRLASLLNRRLNEWLDGTVKGSPRRAMFLERLGKPEGLEKLRNGRALNIVEQDPETGELRYNQSLIEAASVAGFHWVLTARQYASPLKAEDVRSLTGFDVQDDDAPEVQALNGLGMTTVQVVDSLTRVIERFWGLTPNRNAEIRFTQGIPEAIAKEILAALVKTNYLQQETVTLTHLGNTALAEPKTLNFYTINEKAIPKKGDALFGAESILEKAVLLVPEDTLYLDSAIPPVAERQLRNPALKNTSENIKLLEAVNAEAYYVDVPQVQLWATLGLEGVLELLGPGDLKGKRWNARHLSSLTGQRRTLTDAYYELERVVSAVEEIANAKGISPDQVAIRYGHEITRVARLNQKGRYTPVSTKLLRESFLPTRETLDLSNEGSAAFPWFMLAIGQAIGVKVNKRLAPTAIEETRQRLETRLLPALAELRAYHATGKIADRSQFINELKAALGKDLSPVAIHALSEYARWQLASPKERASFTTSLYIEADGVTNGPVNAVRMLTYGDFTEEWVEAMAKGGLFFRGQRTGYVEEDGNGPATMNEQHAWADDKDYYETTTDGLVRRLAEQHEALRQGDPKLYRLSGALSYMMNALLGDDYKLRVDKDGNLQISLGRNLAKNPLTITIYQSGKNGIAGNVLDAMLDTLSARLSEVAQGQPGVANPFEDKAFLAAFNLLTTQKVAVVRGNLQFVKPEPASAIQGVDPQSFELGRNQYLNFRTNLRHLFVEALDDSITDTVGPRMRRAAKILQQATQAQSLFREAHFNQGVQALVAVKKRENPAADAGWLTEQEIDVIRREGLKLFPPIRAPGQVFLPGTSRSTEVNSEGFARSLGTQESSDGFRTPGFIYGPSDAGVSGTPFLIIGMGDGKAVQHMLTQENRPKGTVTIFDGFHFKLSTVAEDSEKANAAVAASWQGNPMDAVERAYRASMTFFDVAALPAETKLKLSRTFQLSSDWNVPADDNAIANALQLTQERLVVLADSIEARNRVLSGVNWKADQMAAAGAPYENQGEVLGAQSNAEVATRLTEKYQQALEEVKNERLARNESVPRRAPKKIDLLSGRSDKPYVEFNSDFPMGDDALKQEITELSLRSTDENGQDLLSPEDLARLTALLNEERRRKEQRENASASSKKAAPSAPLKLGRIDKNSGASVLSFSGVEKLLRQLKLAPSSPAGQIFRQIRLVGAARDYKVVFGSLDQIRAYAEKHGLEHSIQALSGDESRTAGITVFGDRTIYLVDPTPETLVHEIIHAGTFETLVAHYADPSKTDLLLANAIWRLEALMLQFTQLDVLETPENLPALTDWSDAFAAIRSHSQAGRQAEALNEFMAWGLTNAKLVDLQAKTEVSSPLVRLVREVYLAIREFFFGKSVAPEVADDMLSNLLFNTTIVARAQPTLQARLAGTQNLGALRQTRRAYADGARLDQIQRAFGTWVARYLHAYPEDPRSVRPDRQAKVQAAQIQAANLAKSAFGHGFSLSHHQREIFLLVVSVMATQASIDPTTLQEVQRLYEHAIKTLKPKDLMANPASTNPNDLRLAEEMLDFLEGIYLQEIDGAGRSSLVPVFLGLAMTHPGLRQALSRMPMPDRQAGSWSSVDDALESHTLKGMETLSGHLSGTLGSRDVREAIDALSFRMLEVAEEKNSLLGQVSAATGSVVDGLNDKVLASVKWLANRAVGTAQGLEAKASNQVTRTLKASAELMRGIVDEDEAGLVAEAISNTMNRVEGFRPFREIMGDLLGRSDSNKGVYDLIKLTRARAQQDRQQFRERLPAKIVGKFTRKLDDTEWSTLFQGLGKTDFMALASNFSPAALLEMLSERGIRSRAQAISQLEDYLSTRDPDHWTGVKRKAEQLATYMMTGKQGTHLLRNAEAVAKLLGRPPGVRVLASRTPPDAAYVAAVDRLVTLYAMRQLSQADWKRLDDLVRTQANGMQFLLAYLKGQRAEETLKAERHLRARLNHYKGYVPSLAEEGAHIIVADDAQSTDLLQKSYVRVGDYKGSDAERTALLGRMPKRGYYLAAVASRATYQQGIVQNVRQTVSGVEASSGFTDGLHKNSAGRITDKREVDRVRQALMSQGESQQTQTKGETLLPVFDANGNVTAYERGFDPVQAAKVERDTHLARMIGVWRGRQVEEANAWEMNRVFVDAAAKMYQDDIRRSSSNKDQYVDLFDPATHKDDPVLADAVSIMPGELKEYIEWRFPSGQFWVRRDMLNDAVGYRSASIGDAWSGITRYNKGTQDQVRKLVLAFMGNDAYRILLNREQDLKELVKDLRVLIVVKSVIVPAANFISNMLHLLGRGVPIADLVRGVPRKLAEVDTYTKNRVKEIDLQAELRAAQFSNDVVTERRLSAELQVIQDGYRRMSIWPLIEAGELSSISDAGISRDDILLTEGRLQAFMRKQVDRLPGPMQTMGRYAIVSRDTALFQGLQKSVEYGDFIAKAMLYDDLVRRKKRSKEYALGRVTEEFVNYDRLPGRFRGTLEDVGLLWFYNFKIRSAKIALSILRNNPVHALMAGLLPTPPGLGAVGTALDDNIFAKGLEGTLGWSIGPWMGFRAPALNPWSNLVF